MTTPATALRLPSVTSLKSSFEPLLVPLVGRASSDLDAPYLAGKLLANPGYVDVLNDCLKGASASTLGFLGKLFGGLASEANKLAKPKEPFRATETHHELEKVEFAKIINQTIKTDSHPTIQVHEHKHTDGSEVRLDLTFNNSIAFSVSGFFPLEVNQRRQEPRIYHSVTMQNVQIPSLNLHGDSQQFLEDLFKAEFNKWKQTNWTSTEE